MKPMPIVLREPDGSHRTITLAQAYGYVHGHHRVPRGEPVFSSERLARGRASAPSCPSGNSTA